jgi:eukaryotic-like serine/threonine-protein kinase
MTGTKLAHYEIVEHLGSGGMGDVYRATDSKLGRSVAIKLLPAAFASDAERLSRFRREAQVLASLNHSNIAQIYGLEESAETRCIIMELVEGETLQALLSKGPIPAEEALRIARQIAGALEAAHEKGIVHRDLKPGNVMLTKDGNVKVLDFGLAKASEESGSSSPIQNSPTLMTAMNVTNHGVILGTAGYMSPEQARGKSVDRRADIWAFGAVLFEMLTGRRAFSGDDLTEILAAVLKAEPEWGALGDDVSARVRQVLRMCLQKDPRQRAQAIGDVRLALEGTFEIPITSAAPPVPESKTGRSIPWIAFVAAIVAAAALAIPALRHLRETTPAELRTEIVTLPTDSPTGFALSPNGQQIVFVASDNSGSRLWLRALSTTDAQPLPGTEGAILPFWSPDGASIGFFAAGSLKRLDLGGGAPRILAPVLTGGGGTWSADGVILYAPTVTSAIMRIPAGGGTPVAATTLRSKESAHVLPWFLPEGRKFLFYARGSSDAVGIYLSDLDGAPPVRLGGTTSNAGVYLPPSWLLWLRDQELVAQQFDSTQKALVGDVFRIAGGIVDDGRNHGGISVSNAGLIAYRTGESTRNQPAWFNRSGTPLGLVGEPHPSVLNPVVSADGRRVIVSRIVQGNTDLWLQDAARASRLTFDPAVEMYPLISADGSRVIFRSTRTGGGDLFEKPLNGADAEKVILTSAQLKTPTGWSSDERYLMYMSQDPETNADLWVLSLTKTDNGLTAGEPFVFLRTRFREAYGTFSPDGRWVAYQSNESGRMEVYIRAFVPPGSASASAAAAGAQWQISTSGGISPVWRHDGKELYFLEPSGALMAAPIAEAHTSLEPGTPLKLFATRIVGAGLDGQQGRQYGVTRDGRFLINATLGNAVTSPITFIQNWKRPK